MQTMTEGVGQWLDGISGSGKDAVVEAMVNKGRTWLRRAGVQTRNDDLAVLAYECWRGMSDLHHDGDLDDDYEVAGDVLDLWVTDHDAELLVQVVPEVRREMGGEVGGMTAEVTAVHSVLLRVVGEMRETWSRESVA